MQNGANPNNNPTCGKYINVHGPKGSVKVKVVDTCPPCVSGDLDLSPAAFNEIGEFDKGRVSTSFFLQCYHNIKLTCFFFFNRFILLGIGHKS